MQQLHSKRSSPGPGGSRRGKKFSASPRGSAAPTWHWHHGQHTAGCGTRPARNACPPAASSPPAPCCRNPRRQSCGRPCWRGQPGTPGRQRWCTLAEETQQVRGTCSQICPGRWGFSWGTPPGQQGTQQGAHPLLEPRWEEKGGQAWSLARELSLPLSRIWQARCHPSPFPIHSQPMGGPQPCPSPLTSRAAVPVVVEVDAHGKRKRDEGEEEEQLLPLVRLALLEEAKSWVTAPAGPRCLPHPSLLARQGPAEATSGSALAPADAGGARAATPIPREALPWPHRSPGDTGRYQEPFARWLLGHSHPGKDHGPHQLLWLGCDLGARGGITATRR